MSNIFFYSSVRVLVTDFPEGAMWACPTTGRRRRRKGNITTRSSYRNASDVSAND